MDDKIRRRLGWLWLILMIPVTLTAIKQYGPERLLDDLWDIFTSVIRLVAAGVFYPAEIRQWIDRNGGPHKMTVETYWVLYPPDLWAMGYPRCK
jgi:hypothetical protein